MDFVGIIIGVCFSLAICLGVYGLFSWIAKKIENRSIFKIEDGPDIKDLLEKIRQCSSVETLNKTLEELKQTHGRFYNILLVAFDEQYRQLTSNSSFDIESQEQKVRRWWLWAFIVSYSLTFISFFSTTAVELYPSKESMWIGIGTMLLYTAFTVFIIYRSAYLKKEVGWLTISIVIFVLGIVSSMGQCLNPKTLQFLTNNLYLHMTSFLASVFYWVRLRQVKED